MAEIFSVTVEEIIKQLNMEIIYALRTSAALLLLRMIVMYWDQLSGFYEYFNAERVQICGNMGSYLAF